MSDRLSAYLLRFALGSAVAGGSVGIIVFLHSPLIGPSNHATLAILIALFCLGQAALTAAYYNRRVSTPALMLISALWAVPQFLLFSSFTLIMLLIPVYHLFAFGTARGLPVDAPKPRPVFQRPDGPLEADESSEPARQDELCPNGRRPDWLPDK
jgi:hypothetical protein